MDLIYLRNASNKRISNANCYINYITKYIPTRRFLKTQFSPFFVEVGLINPNNKIYLYVKKSHPKLEIRIVKQIINYTTIVNVIICSNKFEYSSDCFENASGTKKKKMYELMG